MGNESPTPDAAARASGTGDWEVIVTGWTKADGKTLWLEQDGTPMFRIGEHGDIGTNRAVHLTTHPYRHTTPSDAGGEAVAVVGPGGYPNWLITWLESPSYRTLPQGTKLYTTQPNPGDARLRASGWLNAEGSYLSDEKRSRMIAAGQREGATFGEVTFGKIAQAHDIPLYAGDVRLRDLAETWRSRINVDPEDPYEHGVSDTLMACREELLSLLDGKGE